MGEQTIQDLIYAGVVELGDGYRTKRSEHGFPGYRIVRVADIQSSKVHLDGDDFVSEDFARQMGSKIATAGDVLLTTKGTVGRVAVMPETTERAVYSPQVCYFRCRRDEILSADYLRYWLQSPEFLEQSAFLQGNTDMAPYISLTDLRTATISLPRPDEQRAIAEVLGALDDKIAANTKLATTTDDLLAAQLESLLESGGAKESRLGDLADVNPEKRSPTPGGSLRYVDIASVGVGEYEWPEVSDWDSAPGRARRGLAPGDVIWSTVRPNRRSHALVLESDPLLVASTGLAVLRAKAGHWSCLHEVLRRPEFTSYLESVAEGSAYPAVKPEHFRNATIPWLDGELLETFERLAGPLRERVAGARQENVTLVATRDALLPALMSGRLRVRDAERLVDDPGAAVDLLAGGGEE